MIHYRKMIALLSIIAMIAVVVMSPLGNLPAASAASGPNLAAGKSMTSSSANGAYPASHANDGNAGTYWESANNAFPQWIQVDLGSAASVNQVLLKLPASWEARTQTLSVQGSTNGSTFSTLAASAGHAFNPAQSNTVTIDVAAASVRYVRVHVTANTGWPAAQLAELEIYGPGAAAPKVIPGKIEAEHYDTMSGIQTEPTADDGGGLNIGWVHIGDWLDYQVNVEQAGTYTVEYRVASTASTGQFQLRSGQTTLATTTVPNTGGWQSWQTVTANVTLSQGQQTLRIHATGPDFNLNWINFRLSSSDSQPPTAPGSLAFTQPDASSIRLAWSAATDNVGVTSYEIYANEQLQGTVNGTTLTYTDSQPPHATVSYYVVAKDAAGNVSPRSNTVTRTGTGGNGNEMNLALGKPMTASSHVHTFTASNASDGDTNTYWEGGGHPSQLTVDLGADHTINRIVVKLNPSSAWSTRTQTIQVLGHNQSTTTFSSLAAAQSYTFNPATGNTVTIPVSATVTRVQLSFTSNSGAPAGQAAELEVWGTPAPNPDLSITDMSWSPASPNESDAISMTAVVRNSGNAGAAATSVNFYLNDTLAGTAPVGALAAGAAANVSVVIGAKNAGTYTVSAKVDEANNSYNHPDPLIVSQIQSADLVPAVAWTPNNPTEGDPVNFTVTLRNQGNMAAANGPHGITLTLMNAQGATVRTLTGSHSGTIAAGSAVTVNMGSWIAVNGSYTITATVTPDANEAASKRENNTLTTSLYLGRGANMPFTILEAEAPTNSTNGQLLQPNFKPGDYAGEAFGRSAVYLDTVGQYVEFTLTSSANAFVLRNAVAENTTGTISVYADGVKKGRFTVTSKFSYVYATPSTLGRLGYDNQPGSGLTAYWLYEDSQLLLDEVFPAGTKIKIQKDTGDVPWIYVDMLETEHVAPAAQNPDPSKYVQVSANKSIEQALNEFRQDQTKKGIFIPAGEWQMNSKIYLYGRATEIIGAGPWHTKLIAPQNQTNTDVGFNISSSANGTIIKDLSAWGNYVHRVDGPGKFIDGDGMQDVTVQNTWVEHFVCLYWGVNSSYNSFKDNRIKNVFADGINMTNGSSYNVIDNNYSRGAGDDAFALFSAVDAGGSYNVGNRYTNLTATCVRRAAAFAVYGGSDNLFQNLYAADTLTYPGITISSLSFGYNTLGFGDKDTVIDGVTLDRTGGDFWTSIGADDKINDYQNFGAIWFYGGDRVFKNILVKNVDINNPVYFGLMFQTKSPENLAMQNVRVENVNINSPGRYGIKLVVRAEQGQGPAVGEASFTNVRVNNPGVQAIYGEEGSPNFTVNRINGNNW